MHNWIVLKTILKINIKIDINPYTANAENMVIS
jgi:hypothetical protein